MSAKRTAEGPKVRIARQKGGTVRIVNLLSYINLGFEESCQIAQKANWPCQSRDSFRYATERNRPVVCSKKEK